MTGFEDRITALEGAQENIAETLQTMQEQLTTLLVHSASNGGVSVIVRDRRVKFTGSMPIGWTLSVLGASAGGVMGVLGKVFGVW